MEPLLAKGGETVIEETVKVIRERLEKADRLAQDDVMRCKIYLEAAQAAIEGLENEYDAILNRAEVCRLTQADDIQTLGVRIFDYLSLDRFRSVLWDVHAGLRGCRIALQANNDRLFIRPGIRRKRQEAITEFVSTLEALEIYIAELEDRDLRYRVAGTGVGLKWLFAIDGCLTQARRLLQGDFALVFDHTS